MRFSNITCTLGVCTDLANELIRRTTANTTVVNLCEDFESFICDDWRKQHTLRPDQGQISYDTVLQDKSNDVLHAYLEASAPPIDTPADRQSFGLLKTAYEACMNETEIKRVGVAPLTAILQRISQVFPVSTSAYSALNSTLLKPSEYGELGQIQLFLQHIGLGPFLDIGVGRDDKDPYTRIVQVFPPSQYTLSIGYYADNATMKSYLDAMSKVFASIHPNSTARSNAAQLSRQVIELERALSGMVPELSDLYDVKKYYNILSLAEMAKVAPPLSLDYVVRSLSPANFSNDRMIIAFPSNITAISNVIARSSKETLQTFFMWRVINTFVNTMLAPELEPLRQLLNTLDGKDPTAFPERWRTCVRHVSSIDTLGWILSRFYAQEYFSERGKKLAESLVTYIKKQYAQTISSLGWVDSSVQSEALKKLDKLVALMGFPDSSPVNVTDPVAVHNFYKDVNLTTGYFDNIWSLLEWSTTRSWGKLGAPYTRAEWQMTAQTVNAYNDINSNAIAFPAAILQIPYFHPDIPLYLNYGVTGWTVGHEVSHAFDNNGRQYDADGRYGSDWWTNHTDAEFTRRSQCFIEQYGNFSVKGLDGSPLHLDGKQTLGENIADAGGIDTAFLAWQQHRKDHPELDPYLPGLEHWTPEQLYFISFANSWCSAHTNQAVISQVYTDVHSPNSFRVKGTLQNSKYFREHFNCPVKEPTCKIW